ncbi:MAG: prepilin-type N-terminal cleavage/methylation domain-containing protein [Magnetococcales bacterium]|nr:prepilin-type N-terminal cleavage/methylation domain-containing protein [Magnetococcales bacterium]
MLRSFFPRRAAPSVAPRRMRSRPGFTLVELSIVLVILGALISVAMKLVPGMIGSSRAGANQERLETMRDALIGFIQTNSRLPCPDTGTDGVEDAGNASGVCAAARGGFPFLTVGLDSGLDVFKFPVIYAPFSDVAVNASQVDLAINPATALTPPRGLDYFCQSLQNGLRVTSPANGGPVVTSLRIQRFNTTDNANQVNQAFLVASAGMGSSDADGNKFDGNNNGTAALLFDDPTRPRGGEAQSETAIALYQYDDQVVAMPFGELAARLKCGEIAAPKTLRIVNESVTAAETGVYIDGGTPNTTTRHYRWCFENLNGSTDTVYTSQAVNGTTGGCVGQGETNWVSGVSVTVTGGSGRSVRVYVRDDNQAGDQAAGFNVTNTRDNIVSRVFSW